MKTTNHENNFVEEISIEEISSNDEYDEDSDSISSEIVEKVKNLDST